MPATIQGQQTYNQFPAFAEPGQLADLAYAEIVSFPAAEVIQPGRAVEMASDGLSVQQCQQTSTTFAPVGVSVLVTARESAGAFNITGYGVGGPQFNIGDTVPVLMRGRIYAEWKGTTQTAFGMPNAYHSSTIATDRGKFTDAATSAGAGVEIANAGHQFRVRQALPGTGNIVLVDVNLPGAA
jgi:hypothetical protein